MVKNKKRERQGGRVRGLVRSHDVGLCLLVCFGFWDCMVIYVVLFILRWSDMRGLFVDCSKKICV